MCNVPACLDAKLVVVKITNERHQNYAQTVFYVKIRDSKENNETMMTAMVSATNFPTPVY